MQRAVLARVLSLALLTGCAALPRTALPGASGAADPWSPPALAPLTPFPAAEYASRRDRLAARMGDGVLLVLGAPEPTTDYLSFEQNPAFRYLTGVLEPGAALLIDRRGDAVRSRLFVLPRDPAGETWEGARLGPDGAAARTGLQSASTAELLPALDSLLADSGTLYTTGPRGRLDGPLSTISPEQQVVRALTSRHPALRVVSLSQDLQALRAAKSPLEIDRIRRAVQITALAQRAALREIEPGRNEFEVQAAIEYTFRRNGAERPSFASIVGSGPHSTTLHYNADDRFMQRGEVVVMDVGASYDGYAADITRTAPVSGRFSAEQRAIYQIVLAAQKAAESQAAEGADWRQLNTAAESVIAEGLTRLGLIDSPAATYVCSGSAGSGACPQFRLFYMHGLGHGIGLEVHDPEVSYTGVFRVGSAFTIEPGVYVSSTLLDQLAAAPANRAFAERIRPALERYRNIGVRIEDDYLITRDGLERLSAGAPREVEEIEALMRVPSITESGRHPAVVDWYRGLQRE